MKRGQEIFDVGVIYVDNHDCMTLSAVQTPDAKSLEEMDYNLVEWYCQNLIILEEGFHGISCFRNDAVLFYPTLHKPTGKRGHLKWYDGKVSNLFLH